MFIQMYHERYMRFPEGREKALTFSYDDGVLADRKLIEIFDRYGLRGTFNLNNELFGVRSWHNRMDEQETYETYKDTVHEIALHGARHIFLSKAPLPLAVKEVADNRAWLEKKFGRIVNIGRQLCANHRVYALLRAALGLASSESHLPPHRTLL